MLMLTLDLDQILTDVRALVERGEIAAAIQQLEQLRPPERSDLVSDLDSDKQLALLSGLDYSVSADIVEDLENREAAELIADLPTRTAVKIIEQMETDEDR
jgi:Mg/Co/Ni transporter MgtE